MKSDSVAFLVGKRVYLRPFLEADLPYLVRWFNDHDGTLSFMGSIFPNTEDGEREWIKRQKQAGTTPSDLVFMIVLRRGDRPIGTMGLHRINWVDRSGTTGAAIGEDKYRSKGYGSEAKELLLRYAFLSLGINRVQSLALASNLRSITYNKKCGYVLEGVLRGAKFTKGGFVDEVIMSILRSDWDKRQKRTRRRA